MPKETCVNCNENSCPSHGTPNSGCPDWTPPVTEPQKSVTNISIKDIRSLLDELTERRESDLRPATAFLNNVEYTQIGHLKSEVLELELAWDKCLWDRQGEYAENDAKNDLAMNMEIVDIQMSAETLLAIRGLDEQQRRDLRKKVIEKNRVRGYYNAK